jgi:hypothetical protein
MCLSTGLIAPAKEVYIAEVEERESPEAFTLEKAPAAVCVIVGQQWIQHQRFTMLVAKREAIAHAART